MNFLVFSLLIAAGIVSAQSSSSSSYCVPTAPVSVTVPVPPSVETGLTTAEVSYPSIYTIGSVISTIDLTSPSFETVESVIEYYEQSYSSLINYMETMYSSPWLNCDTSAFTEVTTEFSTLASAIYYLVSVESSHTSLSAYQSSLQSVMVTDSSILSDLYVYTEVAYPTLYEATYVFSQATLTSPSIFGSVVAVSTAISPYPTLSYAVYSLSYSIYYVPYSVYSEIITMISSPSTVSATTVSYLESCYPDIYSDIDYITSFTYSNPSVVSDFTGYLSVAYSISSVGYAESVIVSYEMPTLSYETSVISSVVSTWPSFDTYISWFSDVVDTSSTLGYAESTMEASFYASPSTAYDIMTALESPSTVTDPSEVSSMEASHQSLVTAIDAILTWESEYCSSASTMQYVESRLTSVFTSQRTVLTAVSYVSVVTSGSTISAGYAISDEISLVSTLVTVMSYITSVTSMSPSLSCAEDIVESYATVYPSIVTSMWLGVYSPSTVVSVTALASEEDDYSSLFYAITSLVSAVSSYPSLATYEYSFIYAATEDSSLLTQWSSFTSASSSASSDIVSPVTCSS